MRKELSIATLRALDAESQISDRLQACLEEEQNQAGVDRQNLLSQITSLVNTAGLAQDDRLTKKVDELQTDMTTMRRELQAADMRYSDSMHAWSEKETILVEEVLTSRDSLKGKMQKDWTTINEHNTSIQSTTRSVHEETVRIVDAQMKDMAVQMQALDEFVTRARSQNENHHVSHTSSVQGLVSSVKHFYSDTRDQLRITHGRIQAHGAEMNERTDILKNTLPPLESSIRKPLSDLHNHILNSTLTEYVPSGETPKKVQYQYPKNLPRTDNHEKLLATITHSPVEMNISDLPNTPVSPSKSRIYTDAPDADVALLRPAPIDGGLREIHVNINAAMSRVSESAINVKPEVETINFSSSYMGAPPLKRHATMESKLPQKFGGGKLGVVKVEGRENVPLSTGRRLRSSPPS